MTLLPGQEYVRKPHPARHAFSVIGLAFWVALIIGGFFAAAYYVSTILTGGNMAAVISSVLIDLTNRDRAEEQLGALSLNPLLTAAAQAKADDMAAKGYFAHVTPEGYQPWHFIQEAGYAYASAGENLAVNFSDSENVEEAWMDSPTHRANILSAKFTEIGIATAVGEYKGKKTTFVVQMFGSPRVAEVAATPQEVIVPENPVEIAVIEEATPQILGSEDVMPQTVMSYSTPWERFAASPENLLRMLYLLCGVVILVALALTTRLELRRHHMRHVVAAVSLIILMGGTMVIADQVLFDEPLVAEAAE